MLPSHTTWPTLSVIEHFMLNSECHVAALASCMFNWMAKGAMCQINLVTFYYMWHGTHAWGWGGRLLDLGLCHSPMPHSPTGTAHTILYSWTVQDMQLFKSLCTGLCFTKMIGISSYLIPN